MPFDGRDSGGSRLRFGLLVSRPISGTGHTWRNIIGRTWQVNWLGLVIPVEIPVPLDTSEWSTFGYQGPYLLRVPRGDLELQSWDEVVALVGAALIDHSPVTVTMHGISDPVVAVTVGPCRLTCVEHGDGVGGERELTLQAVSVNGRVRFVRNPDDLLQEDEPTNGS